MPSGDFNPHSVDANFARIFERLDAQDSATRAFHSGLTEKIDTFQGDLRSQDVRVRDLENSRWKQRGIVAAIAVGVPLFLQWLTGSPHPKS